MVLGLGKIGSFFAFAAFIMLLLVSLGTPIIDNIAFLKAQVLGRTLRIGNWGACLGGSCTSKDLGFRLDDILDSVGGDTSNLGGALRYGLTFALVLHPIATAMAFLAFLFGICNSIATHILGSITAFLALLLTIIALAIDLALFLQARNEINSNLPGSPAELSNAMWLVTASVVALLIASFTICCGGLSERRRRRRSTAVEPQPAYMSEKKPSRFNFFNRNRTTTV